MTKKHEIPKHRDIIAGRLGHKCCYCERPLLRASAKTRDGKHHPRAATIEHLRRKVDGGRNILDNKAVACFECNNGRGNTDWLTYKSIKMGEIAA